MTGVGGVERSPGATKTKKENGLMPSSPGPREDRQECPKQGCQSLGHNHAVSVTLLSHWTLEISAVSLAGTSATCLASPPQSSILLQVGPLYSGGNRTGSALRQC